MFFKEVIGQEKVKSKLIQTVKEARISHTLMLLGNDGTGNLALAIAYAQYINCENKQEDDSCGTCHSCLKYKKLIHPDLHFVYPVNTTKSVTKDPVSDDFIGQWRELVLQNPYFTAEQWYEFIGLENKQGLIGTKESQVVARKLSLKSFESEYKIMIIWRPEKMNAAAANKLLKLIEEPPDKTIFLLVPESDDQILPTILSRSQLLKIPGIEEADLKHSLSGKFNLDEEALSTIVHLAGGSYLKALEAIGSSDENKDYLERFAKWMRLCYTRKALDLINWVDEIYSLGREKQKAFIGFALRMVRENFIMNINYPDINYLTSPEKDFSDRFHPFINGTNIQQISDELNKAYRHVEQNGNARIIFLDMSLKISGLLKK
jgi:DNA polymerase III subunit delta'